MVRLRTLERSMEYLACPKDKRILTIGEAKSRRGKVWNGFLKCEGCSREYPIRRGVLFLFDGQVVSGQRRKLTYNEMLTALLVKDPETCLSALSSFAMSLPRRNRKERLAAIRRVSDFVDDMLTREDCGSPGPCTRRLTPEQRLTLLQAFNAARYNLEDYRGTFVLPMDIPIDTEMLDRGIVFEAGCADGKNMANIRKRFAASDTRPKFYIGLDLSESLIVEAQERFERNDVLFLQGNVLQIPIRDRSVSLYAAFNIWDRITGPKGAATEMRRLLVDRGIATIGNCTPLQYETPDGRIIYVPESERASLREIVEIAGCSVDRELTGIVWKINTLLYGAEQLPMEIVIGKKIKREIR